MGCDHGTRSRAIHRHQHHRVSGLQPDGHTLATGSDDRTARLWEVSLPDPYEAIQMICRAVHRDLTPQEQSDYLPGQARSPVCPGK
ncbi:hypothetical protein [Streptomyces sp. NPDC002671]